MIVCLMVKSPEIVFHKIKSVPINDVEVWDEAEARGLKTEGIRELAESIKREGLQNPPVCQKISGGRYKLLSGQRRFEALKRIGAKNIPILLVQIPYDLEDAKAVSVIENLHRKQMSYWDVAKACDYLVQHMGSMKKASSALGISSTTFRKYYRFKVVPDRLKELVPDKLTRPEAIRLSRIIPNVENAVEIAKRISNYPSAAKKRYLDALEMDPTAPHPTLRRMANHFKEKQNLRIKLSKNQAKALASAATEVQLEPNELVQQLVKKWLSRRGYENI